MKQFLIAWIRPLLFLGLLSGVALAYLFRGAPAQRSSPVSIPQAAPEDAKETIVHHYRRRMEIDSGGYLASYAPQQPPYGVSASLAEVAAAHRKHLAVAKQEIERALQAGEPASERIVLIKASLLHAEGKPAEAYEVLKKLESSLHGSPREDDYLYSVIFFLGVSGLRMGETENCVMCRGQSSCIMPISSAARHANQKGSRLAIEHFTAYLGMFPDDFEVKWLLNLAHMTLGEYPDKVDPRYLISLAPFIKKSPDSIGAFVDICERAGLTRFNESGGAIMDDFDNDGLFDLVVTDWSPSGPMAFYRNKGDGTFEERTKAAGLEDQLGGLYCCQTDFNNDGLLDIYIPRGAWMHEHMAIRPSLLKNNGNGTFTDVTREAGVAAPINSNSASWADFDNDGLVDLFVCRQHKVCFLYRNKGNGTFEDMRAHAGLPDDLKDVLGAAWFDFDNDGAPDLFVNIGASPTGFKSAPMGKARLYRNNRNGTFTDVTAKMGIDGPPNGFSCWAWDYDNDGWLDLFATSSINSLEEVVQGMIGGPHELPAARLYRNLQGKGFRDVTTEVGLDKLCAPMGSNFGDLDNDGYLDFYLGTGNPDLGMLVPNRLFRNIQGKRFAEITASSRTGHLQKGHGIAIGDWRRCGNQDLFAQLGGAIPGDRYHNVLFQNPGQGNNWLSVKLVGRKSNRAAFGARIKAVVEGGALTVHRHVSSGSSFGANPLEQHLGLGHATKVATLEVFWPTSGTTQIFRDIKANQAIVITEFAEKYETRTWKPIQVPK